jgi:regulator of nucleoside diphosphate kinase
MSGFNAMTDDKQSMNRVEETHSEQRPTIVLTTLDRERLFALLHSALTTVDLSIARFLREEIERAEIVPDHVASNSMVRMGCHVKFIDHDDERIRCAKLVFPEESQNSHCISILSSIGSALIGLGPGQSIHWTEHRSERRLTVLEICASEPGLPRSHTERARDTLV